MKNKALFRQYHTLFSWDAGNVNSFLKLFGQPFQVAFSAKVKVDTNLSEGVRCFLQLGALRNKLAHESFAEFPFDLTRSDVMRDYKQSLYFLSEIESALK